MSNGGIAQFAELLLHEVRDRAIESCDTLLDPEASNVIADRWREKIAGESSRELAGIIIPDCVDQTLFHLLHAIDSGILRLSFVTSEGTVVDLTDDGLGELAGWYMGSDGWRRQYSRQRFVDDFEDLK
jgi:hypothetical protein